MRGIRIAVAGVLLFSMIAVVQAQRQPGGGFGFGGGGPTRLVTAESVQKDIKATEEQVAKLREWSRGFRETSQKIYQDSGITFGKGGFDEAMRKKLAEAGEEVRKVAYKELATVLKPEQVNRVKQIEYQQMGTQAFSNDEVIAALKLTKAQQAKMTSATEEFTKARNELFSGLGKGKFDRDEFAKLREKSEKLQEEADKKMMDVLNEGQKAKWKEMTGKPFDLSTLRRGFGRPKKDD